MQGLTLLLRLMKLRRDLLQVVRCTHLSIVLHSSITPGLKEATKLNSRLAGERLSAWTAGSST